MKNLISFVLVASVFFTACGEDLITHEEYGSGYFYGINTPTVSKGGWYESTGHVYVVNDSTHARTDIPVVGDSFRDRQRFLEIKRFYVSEDSTTAVYRPVKISYVMRWETKEGDSQRRHVRYELTGMTPVPR